MKELTYRQQLNIIEGLCLLWEGGAKTKEQTQLIIDDIYKTSHLNGTCKNPHLNWHKDMKKMGKEMKKVGLTDYLRV